MRVVVSEADCRERGMARAILRGNGIVRRRRRCACRRQKRGGGKDGKGTEKGRGQKWAVQCERGQWGVIIWGRLYKAAGYWYIHALFVGGEMWHYVTCVLAHTGGVGS